MAEDDCSLWVVLMAFMAAPYPGTKNMGYYFSSRIGKHASIKFKIDPYF